MLPLKLGRRKAQRSRRMHAATQASWPRSRHGCVSHPESSLFLGAYLTSDPTGFLSAAQGGRIAAWQGKEYLGWSVGRMVNSIITGLRIVRFLARRYFSIGSLALEFRGQ